MSHMKGHYSVLLGNRRILSPKGFNIVARGNAPGIVL